MKIRIQHHPQLTNAAHKIPRSPNSRGRLCACSSLAPPGEAQPGRRRCSHNFLSAVGQAQRCRPAPRSPRGQSRGRAPRGGCRRQGLCSGRLRTYLRLRGFGRLHQVLLLVQRPEADVRQENQSRGEEQRHLQKSFLFPLHGQSRAALLAAAAVSAPPAPRGQALPRPQSLGGARRRGETSPASLTPAQPEPGRGRPPQRRRGRTWRPLPPPRRGAARRRCRSWGSSWIHLRTERRTARHAAGQGR